MQTASSRQGGLRLGSAAEWQGSGRSGPICRWGEEDFLRARLRSEGPRKTEDGT